MHDDLQLKVMGRVKPCRNKKDALGIVVSDLFLGPFMITHIVNIPEDDQTEVITYYKFGFNRRFFERRNSSSPTPSDNEDCSTDNAD